MYCHKCGNKLVKGATFCSYCGTRVEFDLNIMVDGNRESDETGIMVPA